MAAKSVRYGQKMGLVMRLMYALILVLVVASTYVACLRVTQAGLIKDSDLGLNSNCKVE